MHPPNGDDLARIVRPLVGPEEPSRRGPDATASVRATAARLGLVGRLGEDGLPPGACPGGEFAASLERDLLDSAALAWDTPRLATALVWVEDFLTTTRRTPMFAPARGPHAEAGKQWNRRSLDLLRKFICSAPPKGRTRGEHVSLDVASSYTSAIYLLRCREAGYDVAPTETDYVGPLDAKSTKRKERPPGERAPSTGVRAVHISAAATAGFDRTSDHGKNDWAAMVGSHNLLLRGGEVGVPDNARAEPHRVLRVRSFSWRAPSDASGGRPWLIVWVVPIKDPSGAHKGFPTPVARRHGGSVGADPLCAYDAFMLLWWLRVAGSAPPPVDAAGQPLPEWWTLAPVAQLSAALAQPMFIPRSGGQWRTQHSRALFRAVGGLAGLDITHVGGKAARIGGATDARERCGEAGKALVKRRGRWASDVAEVYQRELVSTQLHLSATLGDSHTESLEEMCTGWSQPVHY